MRKIVSFWKPLFSRDDLMPIMWVCAAAAGMADTEYLWIVVFYVSLAMAIGYTRGRVAQQREDQEARMPLFVATIEEVEPHFHQHVHEMDETKKH